MKQPKTKAIVPEKEKIQKKVEAEVKKEIVVIQKEIEKEVKEVKKEAKKKVKEIENERNEMTELLLNALRKSDQDKAKSDVGAIVSIISLIFSACCWALCFSLMLGK